MRRYLEPLKSMVTVLAVMLLALPLMAAPRQQLLTSPDGLSLIHI